MPFAKGSPEARRFMAKLRAMRKKGKAPSIFDKAEGMWHVKNRRGNPLNYKEVSEITSQTDAAISRASQARKSGDAMQAQLEVGRVQTYTDVVDAYSSKRAKGYPRQNPAQLLVLGNPSKLWTAEAAYARWMEWMDKYRRGADTTAMQQVAAAHGWQFVAHGPVYCRPGKRKGGKRANPPPVVRQANPGPRPAGIPPWMWSDPGFHAEVAAFRRRHGPRKRIEILKVKVPKGFPKYMSVYGKSDHAVYNAPAGSPIGKRIHHFGKRGKHKPWLVSSASRGPKFLAYVGGRFKAKPSWIYD